MAGIVGGAIGGAAGGAAGKVAEIAIGGAKNWLVERYRGHQERVREAVARNTNDFLGRLGEKVAKLEEENELNRASVETVLATPAFSRLLQISTLSAAEQSNELKHEILATLVSQRMILEDEDLYSLCAPKAVEAIALCSGHHLQVLAALFYMQKIVFPGTDASFIEKLFLERLRPYIPLQTSKLDLEHLSSLGVLTPSSSEIDLGSLMTKKFPNALAGVWPQFDPVWQQVEKTYQPILSCSLTSVGMLIGATVHSQNIGIPLDMSEWGKRI